jgi:carbon monoxide dehydrogenase subunit G
MALRLFLACAFLMCASFGFATTPPAELNQTELVKVANKELIIHSKEVAKCPWPELTVFALIDASPVEAAAVFSNYEDQKKYIPDLVKSDPARRVAQNETIVNFEMRLPWPLANSRYSTGNIFNRLENDKYEICWYLVESDSLIDSKGTVQFIPYGNKTLLKYQAFVHPGSRLASIFSSRAKATITKTVQAIVSYIEEVRKKNPEKTQDLVNSLHK